MSTQHAERPVPLDTVANRLMLSRAHAGHMSIRQAADVTGLGRGSWQNWERGVSTPRVDHLKVIANALGVDLMWLAFGGPLAAPQDGGPGSVGAITPGYADSPFLVSLAA